MTVRDLAAKKCISGGLDRDWAGNNVDVMVIPDTNNMSITNDSTQHIYGSNRVAIIITVRTDGEPESIEQAIRRAIASVGTAK